MSNIPDAKPIEEAEVKSNIDYGEYDYCYFDPSIGKHILIKGRSITKVTPSSAKIIFCGSEELFEIRHSTYAPDNAKGTFVNEHGLSAYNTFKPSVYVDNAKKGVKEMPKGFMEFLEYFIPHDRIREVFINDLAYHVQTGRAIHLAWIIVGVQGSGKGTLMHFVKEIFGQQNFMEAKATSLLGEKVKGFPETLIAHIDETLTEPKQAKELLNNLKTVVGNEYYSSRALYKDAEPVKNNTMLFFTVNSFDFQIDKGDRRVNIFEPPKQKLDVKFDTAKLREDISNEMQDIVSYLKFLEVDIDTTREIVNTPFRDKCITSNQDLYKKIAEAIITQSLEIFEDDIESNAMGIKGVEKTIERMAKVGFVKKETMDKLIEGIYTALDVLPDRRYANMVRKELKGALVYERQQINKKRTWGYVLSLGTKGFI